MGQEKVQSISDILVGLGLRTGGEEGVGAVLILMYWVLVLRWVYIGGWR